MQRSASCARAPSGTSSIFFSVKPIELERWTHVAVTFDGETVRFYIDGAWVDPVVPRRIAVINPATEEPVGTISLGDESDVNRAVAAARNALPSYSSTTPRQRLDLLHGTRDADPRQQTLRATIAWSHDLLDERERRIFARFAAFAGGAAVFPGGRVDPEDDRLEARIVAHNRGRGARYTRSRLPVCCGTNDPAHVAFIARETLALFGAERCLFGSNFPIEKLWTTYAALIDAHRAGVPATAVYLVSPRSMAAFATSLMCCGVSKSGSPAPRSITSPSLRSRRVAVPVFTIPASSGCTRTSGKSLTPPLWSPCPCVLITQRTPVFEPAEISALSASIAVSAPSIANLQFVSASPQQIALKGTGGRARQVAAHHDAAGGHAAVAHLAGLAVEDRRALAEIDAHADDRAFAHDDAFAVAHHARHVHQVCLRRIELLSQDAG